MITKILNNYYTKQLKDQIYYYLVCTYMININFEEDKNIARLLIKKEEDKNYTSVYSWRKNESLKHLLYIDEVMNKIHDRVEDYLKED